MTRITVRVSETKKEALESLANEYGLNMSQLLRGQVKSLIDSEGEKLPEEIRQKVTVERLKEDGKTKQQAMHLPNNYFEETRKLLDKPFPPLPEELEEMYLKPYREHIELTYDGSLQKRKVAQLEKVHHDYKVLHPESGEQSGEEILDSVVGFAAKIRIDDSMDEAKNFVSSMVDDGILPKRYRDEAFDRVRDIAKEEWQKQWQENAGQIHADQT